MYLSSPLTFSTIIPEITLRFAQQKALGFIDEEPLTYAQMGRYIEALKAFIEKLGIQQGDRVVIYSQNMPNWGLVYFALQCMGAVVVPVLPDFNTRELQNVLQHSETKALFISESLEHRLVGLQKDFIETIIRIDTFKVLEGRRKDVLFDPDARITGTYTTDEHSLAVLLYTSGTTGDPKGVMLSQHNVIINAMQGGGVQTISPQDKFLSVLPLAHTYENTLGLILPMLFGASVTYLRKPPSAGVLIPAMQSLKPELMLTVPMIIEKVYKSSILPKIQQTVITRFLFNYRLTRKLLHRLAGKKLFKTFGGRLKFFGIGGAKLDPVVEQFLRDARFPYAIGYGLTETSPLLAGSNPSQTKFQAIGPAVVNCELTINDPDPVSGEGEIWAKGPNIMLGYYKNETATREVFSDDGWFRTGDLGVFDRSGWLSHKGRLKNLIVGANGENIYPEEIESLINNFRNVVDSVVLQKNGKLVALVHFNREELEQKLREVSAGFTHKVDEKIGELTRKVDTAIEELAGELHKYINTRVNKISRIQMLIIQPEPFQKTATQKIKRYLY